MHKLYNHQHSRDTERPKSRQPVVYVSTYLVGNATHARIISLHKYEHPVGNFRQLFGYRRLNGVKLWTEAQARGRRSEANSISTKCNYIVGT